MPPQIACTLHNLTDASGLPAINSLALHCSLPAPIFNVQLHTELAEQFIFLSEQLLW